MPMSPRIIFTVKPQDLHVLLGKIRQRIYVICNFLFNKRMALSFNILQFYNFHCKTKLRLRVSGRQRKHVCAQESFYLQGMLYK